MRTSHLLYSFCSILLLTTLNSCEKFLSETPRTSVSDEQLFATQEGFEQALNGVYVRMGGESLYGDNLSMGYLSALAKNYNVSPNSHLFYSTNTFTYENSSFINSIWSQAYRSIATLNNMLSFIDERRHVFSSNRYAEIKGESLAIRAFIHFDMLRLFGANYQNQPQAISIPYRKTYTLQVKPAQPANEVIAEILADLTEAETLLADDPINSENLNNRRYRLNRFAILALKARIYQYIGDKAEASRYANMVIASNRFPFVENAAISTINPGRKDRLFTTELVFALRVADIGTWTESGDRVYFRFRVSGELNDALSLSEANFRDFFEATINPTDFRYQYLIEVDPAAENTASRRYPSKYWQTWVSANNETSADRLDQTVPLIRISEMYYILADGANTITEALGYLNTVRQHRGITRLLTPTTINSTTLLREEITKEYRKEFYAEGQTFFWYKLQNSPTMRLYSGVVSPEDYIFPIPAAEVEYNPTY